MPKFRAVEDRVFPYGLDGQSTPVEVAPGDQLTASTCPSGCVPASNPTPASPAGTEES